MKQATKQSRGFLLITLLLVVCMAFAVQATAFSGLDANETSSVVASADTVELTVAQPTSTLQSITVGTKIYYKIVTVQDFYTAFRTDYSTNLNVVFMLCNDFVINWDGWMTAGSATARTLKAGQTLDGQQKNFRLQADGVNAEMDANGNPIIDSTVDHTITISKCGGDIGAASAGALFDAVNGTIVNCSIVYNSAYTTTAANAVVGGLAGTFNGVFENSLFEFAGSITGEGGTKTIGGFAGAATGGATIRDSQINVGGSFILESTENGAGKISGGVFGTTTGAVLIKDTILEIGGTHVLNSLTTNPGEHRSGGVVAVVNAGSTLTLEGGKTNTYPGIRAEITPFDDRNNLQTVTSGLVKLGSFGGTVSGTVTLDKQEIRFGGSVAAETHYADANAAKVTVSGFVGEIGTDGAGRAVIKNSVVYSLCGGTSNIRYNSIENDGQVTETCYRFVSRVTGDSTALNAMSYGDNVLFIGDKYYAASATDANQQMVALYGSQAYTNPESNRVHTIAIFGRGEYKVDISDAGEMKVIPRAYEYTGGDASPFAGWYNVADVENTGLSVKPAQVLTNVAAYVGSKAFNGMPAMSLPAAASATPTRVAMLYLLSEVNAGYDFSLLSMDVNGGLNYKWNNITMNSDVDIVMGTPAVGNGGNPFQAVFNGNDHTVTYSDSAVMVNRDSGAYVGLFGHNRGTIQDLNLVMNADIKVSSVGNVNYYIGALCGFNDGRIENVDAVLSASMEMSLDTGVTEGTIFAGGLVGAVNPATGVTAALTNVNVVNRSTMRLIAPLKEGGLQAYVGGVLGYADAPEGKTVDLTGIAAEIQGQLYVDNTASYIGGIAGAIISTGGRVAISSIGVSVGRYSLTNPDRLVFQNGAKANDVTEYDYQQNLSASVGNIAGFISCTSSANLVGTLSEANPTVVAKPLPFQIWISTDTEEITVAEDDTYVRKHFVFGYVGTENNPGAVTSPDTDGILGSTSIHNKILIEGAVLAVRINELGQLVFQKPAIEGYQFAGWFDSPTVDNPAYVPNRPTFNLVDGNLVTIAGTQRLKVYTYILSERISKYEELTRMSKIVSTGNNFEGVTFSLTQSITLGNAATAFKAIGTVDNPFSGAFNGLGNTITVNAGGLVVNGAGSSSVSYLALFTALGDKGSVYHLNLEYVGFNNAHSDSGTPVYFGGLVGLNAGTVGSTDYLYPNRIYYEGCIIEAQAVGGIVAENATAESTAAKLQNTYVYINNNCVFSAKNQTGKTTTASYVGGAVASNSAVVEGVVVEIADGTEMYGTSLRVAAIGGIAGYNNGLIDNVCADYCGDVTMVLTRAGTQSTYTNFGAGGIVGTSDAILHRAFMLIPEGTVLNYTQYNGQSMILDTVGHVDSEESGNIIKTVSGYDAASYCADISVTISSDNTLQFSTDYLNAGFTPRPFAQWSSHNNSATDSEGDERIMLGVAENRFVPQKQYQIDEAGNILSDNGYHGYTLYALYVNRDIASVADLAQLSSDINNGFAPYVSYLLKTDLSITVPFTPIGLSSSAPFVGVFVGNGKTISVRIADLDGISGVSTFISLFGYTKANSEIRNLTLTLEDGAYTVTGTEANGNPALLAQENSGRIDNVVLNVNGAISGKTAASAGVISNKGTMVNITVNLNSTITAPMVGLLAVNNEGTIGEANTVAGAANYSIKSTIATGAAVNAVSLTTAAYAGGLVARNSGTIYFAHVLLNGSITADSPISSIAGGLAAVCTDGIVEDCVIDINGTLNAADYLGGLAGTTGACELVDSVVTVNSTLGQKGSVLTQYVGGVAGSMGSATTGGFAQDLTVYVYAPMFSAKYLGGMFGEAHGNISNGTAYMYSELDGATVGGVIGNDFAVTNGFRAYIGDSDGAYRTGIHAETYAGGFSGRSLGQMTNVLIQLYTTLDSDTPSNDATYTDYVGSVTASFLATGSNTGLNVWAVMHNDKAYFTGGNYGVGNGFNQMKIVGQQTLDVNMNNATHAITFIVLPNDQAEFSGWYNDIANSGRLFAGAVPYPTSLVIDDTNTMDATYHACFYDIVIDSDNNDDNAAQLKKLAEASQSKNIFNGVRITLLRDIDMTGKKLYSFGSKDYPFGGIFEGGSHILTLGEGSSIGGGEYSGMFGSMTKYAEVRNLVLNLAYDQIAIGGEGSPYSGVMAGIGNGRFSNILINTLSEPTAVDAGLFAGKLETGTVTENVWIVSYNSSMKVTSETQEITNIADGNLVSDSKAFGVNRINVIGQCDMLVATLIAGEVRFAVPTDMANQESFGGWYSNSTLSADEKDYKLLADSGYGAVTSEQGVSITFVPDKDIVLSSKVITLSFIKLTIVDENDFFNFINNVNTFTGLDSVTFSFEPEDHELVIENRILTPIGKDYDHYFESTFEGNFNTLVFRGCTFKSEFASIFGYIAESGKINNTFIYLYDNNFGYAGEGAVYVNYSAGLAANNAGEISKVVLVVEDTNNFEFGRGKATFVGALNETAKITDSWVVIDEFITTDAIASDFSVAGNNTLNVLKLAGDVNLKVTSSSEGKIGFTAVDVPEGFGVYINTDLANNEFAFLSDTYQIENDIENASYVILSTSLTIDSTEAYTAFAAFINRGTDYPGITYHLAANITLTGEIIPVGGVIGSRVDGKISVFSGNFNGNGNTITIAENAVITGTNAALFGRIGAKATISDLNLVVVGTIGTAETNYAAGIVATSEAITLGEASISDCTVVSKKTAKFVALYSAAYIVNKGVNLFDGGKVKNTWAVVYNSLFNDRVLNNSTDHADVNIMTIIGGGEITVLPADGDLVNKYKLISRRQPDKWVDNFAYVNGFVDLSDTITDANIVGTEKDVDGVTDLYVYYASYDTATVKGRRVAVSYLNTQIGSTEDLVQLSVDVNDFVDFYGIEFVQTADNIVVTNDDGFNPIGNALNSFNAVYNGKNKTITLAGGLTINAEYAGLFGVTGASSVIKNLKVVIEDAAFKTIPNGYAGTVAYNAGTIDSLVVESFGLKLSVSEGTGTTYLGGGIGFSESLDVRNSWTVTSTANLLDAVGVINRDTPETNGMNQLTVIGYGRITSSIKTVGEITTVTFSEVEQSRDDEYKESGWYQDYAKVVEINNTQGRGLIQNEVIGSQSITSFTPVTNAINMRYEVALIYTDIRSIDDLNALAYDVNAGYKLYNMDFTLWQDIEISETAEGFTNVSIGTGSDFYGVLTGNNRSIYVNVTGLSGKYYRPLFDVNNGSIRDLKLIIRRAADASIPQSVELLLPEGENGLLAKSNYKEIDSVSVEVSKEVSVKTSLNGSVALIVGTNTKTGTITNSSINLYGGIIAAGSAAQTNVGLVTIHNNGSIDSVNVQIYGSINSDGNIGGVAAYNNNVISQAIVSNLHMLPVKSGEGENTSITIEHQNRRRTPAGLEAEYFIVGAGYVGLIAAVNESIIDTSAASGDSLAIQDIGSARVGFLVGINRTTIQNSWLTLLAEDEANRIYSVGTGRASNNVLIINGSGLIDISVSNGEFSFENRTRHTFAGETDPSDLGKGIYGWFDVDGEKIEGNEIYGAVDTANGIFIASATLSSQVVYVMFTNEIITNADDFLTVASFVNSGDISISVVYLLKNDIVLNEEDLLEFVPIGTATNNFNCSFVGAGHTITINADYTPNDTNAPEYLGIFGYIGQTGKVSDLNVRYVRSFGSEYSMYVGGLAAVNNGSIDNCHVVLDSGVRSVSLMGQYVGGLVYSNKTNGNIQNSSVELSMYANIYANISAGGIAVENQGGIAHSTIKHAGTIAAVNETNKVIMAAGVVTINNGYMNDVNLQFIFGSVATARGNVQASSRYNGQIGSGMAYASMYAVKNTGEIMNVILRVPRSANFMSNNVASYNILEQKSVLVLAEGSNPQAVGFIATNMDTVKNAIIEIPASAIDAKTSAGGKVYEDVAIYSTNVGNESVRNVWVLVNDINSAIDMDDAIVSNSPAVNVLYLNNNLYNVTSEYKAEAVGQPEAVYISATFERSRYQGAPEVPIFRKYTADGIDSLSVTEGLIATGENAFMAMQTTLDSEGLILVPVATSDISCENDWYALAGYINSHNGDGMFDSDVAISIRISNDITLNGEITPIYLNGTASSMKFIGIGGLIGSTAHTITIGENATFVGDDKALFTQFYGTASHLIIELLTDISGTRAAAFIIDNHATKVEYIGVKMQEGTVISTTASADTVTGSPILYTTDASYRDKVNNLGVLTSFDNAWVVTDGNTTLGVQGIRSNKDSFLLVRGDGDVNMEIGYYDIVYKHNTEYLETKGGYFVGTTNVVANAWRANSSDGRTQDGSGKDLLIAENSIVDYLNLIVTIDGTTGPDMAIDGYLARLTELAKYTSLPTNVLLVSYGLAKDYDTTTNNALTLDIGENKVRLLRIVLDENLYKAALNNTMHFEDVRYVDDALEANIYFESFDHIVFRRKGSDAANALSVLKTTEDGARVYVDRLEFAAAAPAPVKYTYTSLVTTIDTAEDFHTYIGENVALGNNLAGITFYIGADFTIGYGVSADPVGTENTSFRGVIQGNNHIITIDNQKALFAYFGGAMYDLVVTTASADSIILVENASEDAVLHNIRVKANAKLGDFIVVYEEAKRVNGILTPYVLPHTQNYVAIDSSSMLPTYQYRFVVNSIYDVAEWNQLSKSIYMNGATYSGVTINIMADLDGVGVDGKTSLLEVAFSSTSLRRSFNGILNGNNHTITTSADAVGGGDVYLLGSVAGEIRNLKVCYTSTYMPFIRQNTIGILTGVTLSYAPRGGYASDNFVLWYASNGEILETLTNAMTINPYSASVRNYAYTIRFNEVSTYEELVALTESAVAGHFGFPGQTLYIRENIEIPSVSQYIADVVAFNPWHSLTADMVTGILPAFAGTLEGDFHYIAIESFDVDNFCVFDGIADSTNTSVKDFAVIVRSKADTLPNQMGVIDNTGVLTAGIFDNVWLIRYDTEVEAGNNNIRRVTIDDPGKGTTNIALTSDTNGFVIQTKPTTNPVGTDAGFFYDSTTSTSVTAVNGTFTSLVGETIYNKSYALTRDLDITIKHYYFLQAYIGASSLYKGLGKYEDGAVATIDVAAQLGGYILDDAEYSITGNTVQYTFAGKDKRINIKSVIIENKTKVYNGLAESSYDIPGIMTSITTKYPAAPFSVNIVFVNDADSTETLSARYSYDVSSATWALAIGDTSAPIKAGTYLVSFEAKQGNAVIGTIERVIYVIEKANLFKNIYVATKPFDGNCSLKYSSNNLNIIESDFTAETASVLDEIILEYDEAGFGVRGVKVARNLSTTSSNASLAALARNYEVKTDIDGYLLIGGERVYGTIAKRALSLSVSNAPLEMDYGSKLEQEIVTGENGSALTDALGNAVIVALDNYTAQIEYMTTGGGIVSGEVKAYRRSSIRNTVLSNDQLTAIDIATGVSGTAITTFYVAIILEDTQEGFNAKNVGTYVSSQDIAYCSLYAAGNENYTLQSDVEKMTVVVNARPITIKVLPYEIDYGTRSLVDQQFQTSFQKQYVRIDNLVAGDRVVYTITSNETDMISTTDVNGKTTLHYLLDINKATFDAANPNYELSIKQAEGAAEARTKYVYNMNGTEIVDAEVTVKPRTLTISKITNYERIFGVPVIGASYVKAGDFTAYPMSSSESIVLYTTADVNGGTIDTTKAPSAHSNALLAAGSYDFIFKMINNAGEDVTAHYIFVQPADAVKQYTVKTASVKVDGATIVVERLPGDEAKVYYSVVNSANNKFIVDGNGNRVVYEETISLAENKQLAADADYRYNLKFSNGTVDSNLVFGGVSNAIKPIDVLQHVEVSLDNTDKPVVSFTYGDYNSKDIFDWTKYFNEIKFYDRNSGEEIASDKFTISVVLIDSLGTSYTYDPLTGKVNGKDEVSINAGAVTVKLVITSADLNFYYDTVTGVEGASATNNNQIDDAVLFAGSTPALADDARTQAVTEISLGNLFHIEKKNVIVMFKAESLEVKGSKNKYTLKTVVYGDRLTTGELAGSVIDADEYNADGSIKAIGSLSAQRFVHVDNKTDRVTAIDNGVVPAFLTDADGRYILQDDTLTTTATKANYLATRVIYQASDSDRILNLESGSNDQIIIAFVKRVVTIKIEEGSFTLVEGDKFPLDKEHATNYDEERSIEYKVTGLANVYVNDTTMMADELRIDTNDDGVELAWNIINIPSEDGDEPNTIRQQITSMLLTHIHIVTPRESSGTINYDKDVTENYVIVLPDSEDLAAIGIVVTLNEVPDEGFDPRTVILICIVGAVLVIMIIVMLFFMGAINRKNRQLLLLKENEDLEEGFEYYYDDEDTSTDGVIAADGTSTGGSYDTADATDEVYETTPHDDANDDHSTYGVPADETTTGDYESAPTVTAEETPAITETDAEITPPPTSTGDVDFTSYGDAEDVDF